MNTPTILQAEVIRRPGNTKIFLEGPAGVGKTTTGVERLLQLLENGERGDSILVITPQRTLAAPYIDGLNSLRLPSGGSVTTLTLGGLAQRMVNLFWPLVAQRAGFTQPDAPPTFLTLETAQYYMAYLVRPLLKEGYFDSVIIDRNRLYSQIIDNLNKASVVRFPYTEIGERLKAAWTGEPGQLRVYDDTQVCATRFRQFCLENNLLDFSLQMDVFANFLWPLDHCYDYLTRTYRHLIIDNIEEDTPLAHDLLSDWLAQCKSALVIYDRDAGYRRFLGADPDNAYRLKDICDEQYAFEDSFVTNPEIEELEMQVINKLAHHKPLQISIDPRPA
jgi:superfamily I DNA/RNA helicase